MTSLIRLSRFSRVTVKSWVEPGDEAMYTAFIVSQTSSLHSHYIPLHIFSLVIAPSVLKKSVSLPATHQNTSKHLYGGQQWVSEETYQHAITRQDKISDSAHSFESLYASPGHPMFQIKVCIISIAVSDELHLC